MGVIKVGVKVCFIGRTCGWNLGFIEGSEFLPVWQAVKFSRTTALGFFFH